MFLQTLSIILNFELEPNSLTLVPFFGITEDSNQMLHTVVSLIFVSVHYY